MSISSPQISTLVKIMESLPASLLERVTDHLREYIRKHLRMQGRTKTGINTDEV